MARFKVGTKVGLKSGPSNWWGIIKDVDPQWDPDGSGDRYVTGYLVWAHDDSNDVSMYEQNELIKFVPQ